MNGPPGAVAWDVNGERKTAADETVELVVDRICRLDGATRTVVMIEKEDIQIGIGGGNDRRVIAYYTRDSLVFSIQSAIRTKRVRLGLSQETGSVTLIAEILSTYPLPHRLCTS